MASCQKVVEITDPKRKECIATAIRFLEPIENYHLFIFPKRGVACVGIRGNTLWLGRFAGRRLISWDIERFIQTIGDIYGCNIVETVDTPVIRPFMRRYGFTYRNGIWERKLWADTPHNRPPQPPPLQIPQTSTISA